MLCIEVNNYFRKVVFFLFTTPETEKGEWGVWASISYVYMSSVNQADNSASYLLVYIFYFKFGEKVKLKAIWQTNIRWERIFRIVRIYHLLELWEYIICFRYLDWIM